MQMSTIGESVQLTVLHCGKCGITFAAPSSWVSERRDKGESGREFWCPNGHNRIWTESELDRVRRQLMQEQSRANTLKQELRERSEALEKSEASAKRLKKRAAAGVCPCCHRTVSQMARHMKSKHPGFVAGKPCK